MTSHPKMEEFAPASVNVNFAEPTKTEVQPYKLIVMDETGKMSDVSNSLIYVIFRNFPLVLKIKNEKQHSNSSMKIKSSN